MYEELPFENEPVPAVEVSLAQSATCGHFNNKSCLKSSAHGLTLSCSAQGLIDIFPLSKLSPVSHVLWIVGLRDLCYFTDMDIAFACSVLKNCFMLIFSLFKKFDISMRTEKSY